MSFVLALARTTMERLLERVLTDTGARTAAVFVAKDIIVSKLWMRCINDQNLFVWGFWEFDMLSQATSLSKIWLKPDFSVTFFLTLS